LLDTFNDTAAAYPRDKTLAQLFEEQVEKTPDHIAVVFEDRQLTYRALNESANRVAHCLRERYDIQSDDIVALQLERSEWMIIAILGVLKSGGAYLPMAPDAPETRVLFMLQDSSAKVLLTDENTMDRSRVFEDVLPVLVVEHLESAELVNPEGRNDSHSLAYVIYTSGTTGRPKGVLLEHGNAVRLFLNDRSLFDFNDCDVWTFFHSYAFDFSVWEMYGALLFGGKLIVVPKIIAQDTISFLRLLRKEGVTVLNQTPSAFYNLIEVDGLEDKDCPALRYVVFVLSSLLRLWPGVVRGSS